jgi:3-deoxy-D-manno-octulosonate 8-phosphate phosphatase (KDO 8-P phosphatase)
VLERLGVAEDEVAVMGDDLTDLPLMRRAGLALAPANAVAEVRRAAHWVSRRRGGEGAVREAVEMLLRSRRAWPPRPA